MHTLHYKTSYEFSGYAINLYVPDSSYVNEITPRQWDFLATIIKTGTAKGINSIFTIPIYSIITFEVLDINGNMDTLMLSWVSSKKSILISSIKRVDEKIYTYHGRRNWRMISLCSGRTL